MGWKQTYLGAVLQVYSVEREDWKLDVLGDACRHRYKRVCVWLSERRCRLKDATGQPFILVCVFVLTSLSLFPFEKCANKRKQSRQRGKIKNGCTQNCTKIAQTAIYQSVRTDKVLNNKRRLDSEDTKVIALHRTQRMLYVSFFFVFQQSHHRWFP